MLARRRADRAPEDGEISADRAARLERLAARTRPASSDAAPVSGPRRPRRRHPAGRARLAAFGLSLATTAGLAAVFATTARPASTASSAIVVFGGDASEGVGALIPATPVTAAPVATSAPTVVDGAVFRNKWGPVQVEATFGADGSITDVVALQTPNDRSKSVQINDSAVPRLNSEALTAQAATVHTVSGATYTSDGYRDSLQSAIDAARAAGVTTIA
jgi:uncharacterized protein with FMN-binding domain